MEQTELLALIERSKQGDRAAQDTLMQTAQKKIYYHCKKMLKNEEDAQDATQDVLIVIFTSLDKLREPAAFWGWVNGITANRCRHLLSEPHKEGQIPEDEDGNSMLDSIEDMDEQFIPDKALDNEETRRMVLGLVDDLPPEQRMSVLYYYYDEMSVRQIAEAMDTSEGTVKSRLNYARKAIKRGAEEYERKGAKLYSVSPLLLLPYFLRMEAEATALNPASAAAIAKAVAAATEGAVSGTAAAGGTAAVGAGSTASGTTAAAAAGTAAKAGGVISTKLIAGIVAGAVILGGATAGVALLGQRDTAEPEAPAVTEIVLPDPEPESDPEPEPFAVEYGFPIVEPHAYEKLDGVSACSVEDAVYYPVTYSITAPEITVSEPDGEGYVTYTITYQSDGDVHFGLPGSYYDSFMYSRGYWGFELYDYYTGLKYPCSVLATFEGSTSSSSSATTVEHNGERFQVYFAKTCHQISGGDCVITKSSDPGVYWDVFWNSVDETTIEIRVPADYDGLLLGINCKDPYQITEDELRMMFEGGAEPEAEEPENWDLTEQDPTHYEFIRLSCSEA